MNVSSAKRKTNLFFFSKANAERERVDRTNFERQIREKTRDIADLQDK